MFGFFFCFFFIVFDSIETFFELIIFFSNKKDTRLLRNVKKNVLIHFFLN